MATRRSSDRGYFIARTRGMSIVRFRKPRKTWRTAQRSKPPAHEHAFALIGGQKRVPPDDPYMPSNGTEGEIFTANWCENGCKKYRHSRDSDTYGCPISDRAYSGIQPRSWVHGVDGWGQCLAWEPRGARRDPRKERAAYERAMRSGT